jgi:WD40 repeat protein
LPKPVCVLSYQLWVLLQLWDLRNQRAPKATLHGHSGGVLGLSWCQQDAGFLLSSGKDNRCGNSSRGFGMLMNCVSFHGAVLSCGAVAALQKRCTLGQDRRQHNPVLQSSGQLINALMLGPATT